MPAELVPQRGDDLGAVGLRLPGTEQLMELPLSIMDSALLSSRRMRLTPAEGGWQRLPDVSLAIVLALAFVPKFKRRFAFLIRGEFSDLG